MGSSFANPSASGKWREVCCVCTRNPSRGIYMKIISTLLIALGLMLAGFVVHDALAQTSGSEQDDVGAEPNTALPDMRLWSFGDCSRQFVAESAKYKECVRTVGSEEAKDARAYHVCTTSHQRDRAEAARCKQAYDEKKKLAKDLAAGQTPLSSELIHRVKS